MSRPLAEHELSRILALVPWIVGRTRNENETTVPSHTATAITNTKRSTVDVLRTRIAEVATTAFR